MRRARSSLPWPSFANAWRVAFALAAILVLAGLSVSLDLQPRSFIVLATTTSARDSGLLEYLVPIFQQDTGIGVRYVAVGTGQALDLGRRGDADVLLVHAPDVEAEFMAEGHGRCRNPVMHNEFIVVGSSADPAGIRGLTDAAVAFERILETESLFVSRGDGSGTHLMEMRIWSRVGYSPSVSNDPWYIETGQGMAATLGVSDELRGYTLTDDATYAALSTNLDLRIDLQGDPGLRNVYSVIPVSPILHPGVFAAGAVEFARWLVSLRGQGLIGNFTVGGLQPFHPDGQDLCAA